VAVNIHIVSFCNVTLCSLVSGGSMIHWYADNHQQDYMVLLT